MSSPIRSGSVAAAGAAGPAAAVAAATAGWPASAAEAACCFAAAPPSDDESPSSCQVSVRPACASGGSLQSSETLRSPKSNVRCCIVLRQRSGAAIEVSHSQRPQVVRATDAGGRVPLFICGCRPVNSALPHDYKTYETSQLCDYMTGEASWAEKQAESEPGMAGDSGSADK